MFNFLDKIIEKINNHNPTLGEAIQQLKALIVVNKEINDKKLPLSE